MAGIESGVSPRNPNAPLDLRRHEGRPRKSCPSPALRDLPHVGLSGRWGSVVVEFQDCQFERLLSENAGSHFRSQAVIVRSGKLPFNVALRARLHFLFSGGAGTIAARSPALGASTPERRARTDARCLHAPSSVRLLQPARRLAGPGARRLPKRRPPCVRLPRRSPRRPRHARAGSN
jgi:hypothetical protein